MKKSPLLEACYWGKTEEARQLIAAGADVHERDDEGNTPLFYAVGPYGGNFELVILLVEAGAEVNARNHAGESLIAYGRSGVSSSGENNTFLQIEAYLHEHGFQD